MASDNCISVPTSRQVDKLTKRQKATIDGLLERYPYIIPAHVRCYYDHYCYARNWHVAIEVDPEAYHTTETITRCDHSHTAHAKAKVIREYIAQRTAARQDADGGEGGE